MERNEKGEERKTGRGTARKGKEWAGMERISRGGKEKKGKGSKGKQIKGIEWKEQKGMKRKGKGSRCGKKERLPNGRRYVEEKQGEKTRRKEGRGRNRKEKR